jgi:hypothetical protein
VPALAEAIPVAERLLDQRLEQLVTEIGAASQGADMHLAAVLDLRNWFRHGGSLLSAPR